MPRSAASISPCSSISGDVWPAHIALDGTQYVRSRKAITIRFRENCPISSDTTGEYRKIYIRTGPYRIGGTGQSVGCEARTPL